jgi:hypothetical protein
VSDIYLPDLFYWHVLTKVYAWQAPELLEGDIPHMTADVYALGMVRSKCFMEPMIPAN